MFSIKPSATRISDYDATAGERRAQTAARSGSQAGDPTRAAEAIVAATQLPNPPLRLVLGAAALRIARGKIEAMARDFDGWETTTLGADFPDSAERTF